MASINDLAAAATIASSAVALQSSPTEPSAAPASPSPPPPPAPLSPSAAAAAAAQPTPPPAPATQETPGPAQAQPPPPLPPPSSSEPPPPPSQPTPSPTVPASSAVLAAPQISPQDAVSAQFPAPASAPTPAASGDGDDDNNADDDGAGPGATGATTTSPHDPEGAGENGGGGGAPPPRRKPVRGAFVVFEGMDRAGKTTQAKLLQQRCIEEGKEVKFMRFPDRTTPIGQMIDAYLRGQTEIEDHVIHLLFSANRWEALKTIQTTLAAGVSIICDRYYHSGIVYSAAKQNPALPLAWAKAPEVGLPRPDLVLFLDLDERVARERGGWGGEVYEKGEMQRRVRELFWGLSMGDLGSDGNGGGSGSGSGNGRERRAASAPNNGAGGPGPTGPVDNDDNNNNNKVGGFLQEKEDLEIIDADLPVEELAEKVWAHVQPRLETVERGDVGTVVRTVH